MNKSLLIAALILATGSSFAATDHYILRDGNHVQHLKITKINDDIKLSLDVDFEPNANETDKKSCSAVISGDAKSVGPNEVILKKHSEGEATYCELKVHLSPNGAKVEQTNDCDNFVTGICHFSTDGKEMVKIK